MNIVTRFGNWIEKHWPEKMTVDEVKDLIETQRECIRSIDASGKFNEKLQLEHRQAFEQLVKDTADQINGINIRIGRIEQDFGILKTQVTIKSRIVGDTPNNMTPFASRPQPVQPANGQATAGGAK